MRPDIYNSQQYGRGESSWQAGRAGSGEPPNFGSARSDYGDRAYGGRLNERGMDRNWWDRAADEVSSWAGDEDAARRRRNDERLERSREHRSDRGARGSYPFGFDPIESDAYRNMAATEYTDLRQDWRGLEARDVMTRDAATVHPNDPVRYAAQLMERYDCGAIPVVNNLGKMIGMITDRDITIRLTARGADPFYAAVGDCMTRETFACHHDDQLIDCMRSMSRHQIRRVPILNERDQVVGIISQSDLARHAAQNRRTGERRAFSNVVCAVSEPTSEPYR